jgi:hypothetical protein
MQRTTRPESQACKLSELQVKVERPGSTYPVPGISAILWSPGELDVLPAEAPVAAFIRQLKKLRSGKLARAFTRRPRSHLGCMNDRCPQSMKDLRGQAHAKGWARSEPNFSVRL